MPARRRPPDRGTRSSKANDPVGRFLGSEEFTNLQTKQNLFRPGRTCWVCKKAIRSPLEHGGGRPGAYNLRQSYRAAVRSIIRTWKHMHWICLARNPDELLLKRIFGRAQRRSRWNYADLFRGETEGLPFRIAMYRRGRWRFTLQFGALQVPPARRKNLVLGFNLTARQWPRFVAKVLGSKREANSIVIGKSGGLACSDEVNDYLVDAVKTAEARRRVFFSEYDKDKTIQGPIL